MLYEYRETLCCTSIARRCVISVSRDVDVVRVSRYVVLYENSDTSCCPSIALNPIYLTFNIILYVILFAVTARGGVDTSAVINCQMFIYPCVRQGVVMMI